MTEYHTFCTKCGKGYAGYDNAMEGLRLDGKFYCIDCAPVNWVEKDGEKYIEKTIIRDARNRDSFWDEEPLYYTSMDELIKECKADRIRIVKRNTKPSFADLFVPVKLTGSVFGEHYEIEAYHNYPGDQAGWYYTAYVFAMREDMKKYPLDVKE